ncbi:methyltransferase domain-containing protein [Paenarthrobacter aurescens]|uniref:Methyltransferase n=1 Tax=Paenarthrobacter aurescens TaxID=43663 RepID=A0A4Y3NDX7_PAEAU|nr:methyltransferase domain-containing protein [Paenarthrobacter aurescens]MDO6143184.1 class I SAM-dependent methyltransferase [Paenarthrobacter aurescens]MDO6147030.1 class I SAM-dependent methyltransferase [Paenarthrobacter aurescens]MDO6158276.1 class I SAM-dependent methyltransferase [Paenarthrobacter aurescens]MDO6162260.1 class I SAM-dependent methyltransferase [Paenarthrobacter aurescens]GEB20174.1 methyltransferase [Paenarthrobacter aurescens]
MKTDHIQQQETSTPHQDSVEQAAARMIGILNDSSIALLIGVGHQTGLFETLKALPAASSSLIADASGLNERYVREWLGGMTSAGLVNYQADPGTYVLRPEFVPVVTGAGTENLARTLQYVALMGEVAPKIAQAFYTGGGTSYEDYPRFHRIMASESAAVNDASLLETILPLTGCVEALRRGISVADIGCGEGHALNLMANAFPASSFTGYDFSAEAITAAAAEAAALGLLNVHFELQDVTGLEVVEAFDLVTAFDAIHDQAHPAEVLANIQAALRPGGTFLMVDINASSRLEENGGLPWAGFLYTISTFHCMAVSLGQGGEGLGTVWGREKATDMLRNAGFGSVEVKELEEDPFNAYFIAKS